jgi:hypothetical protein
VLRSSVQGTLSKQPGESQASNRTTNLDAELTEAVTRPGQTAIGQHIKMKFIFRAIKLFKITFLYQAGMQGEQQQFGSIPNSVIQEIQEKAQRV